MEPVIGFFIAAIIAMTGVGVGTILTPVLAFVLGIPPTVCVATALAFGSVVKIPAVLFHLNRRVIDFRVLLKLLAGGLPGVMLGVLVLKQLVPMNRGYFQVILGAIILICSCLNLVLRARGTPQEDNSSSLPWVSFPIGLSTGFSSAGAGSLGGLALVSLSALSPAQVAGTNLVFGFTLALFGGGMYALFGMVDAVLLLKLLAGGVPGAICGAWLANYLPARPVRLVLRAWLLVVGTLLLLRGAQELRWFG